MAISMNDEVSLEGTYLVHKDILLGSMGLKRDKVFKERLRIIVGDQMTIERIRSIRAECVESKKDYDRRE